MIYLDFNSFIRIHNKTIWDKIFILKDFIPVRRLTELWFSRKKQNFVLDKLQLEIHLSLAKWLAILQSYLISLKSLFPIKWEYKVRDDMHNTWCMAEVPKNSKAP